ncbi:N-methyl-L-tryptophan oxidase [Lunatibacter salilacus]|uniref:N-methyl-L-tryptophan oxidase n=1 Tax=Lunatibacter salilacus TaxID=2483804 RepID=UPI00131CA6E1|nr:N-methyl-L-tryptophan oxidase [Lunatibacter salilacus]
MVKRVDVVVIGLGGLGSSVLWHLSQAGVRVLGIDQFDPPHDMGSSHGETRITRLAVGEGEAFLPLVARSHQLWREIECLTGVSLFTQCGALLIDSKSDSWTKHGAANFFDKTVSYAQQSGIPFQLMEKAEVSIKFPCFNLERTDRAYFEPGAGFLRPEVAIEAQLELARLNGAEVMTGTKVKEILPISGDRVKIIFESGSVEAGQVVVAAGAWVKDFLPERFRTPFSICRQVLHWLPIERGAYNLGNTPVYMWGFGGHMEDFVYGFPSLDGRCVKMASESFVPIEHPDLIDRTVSRKEQIDFFEEKVGDRFLHLKRNGIESKVCLYTVTPDANFIVGHLPGYKNIYIASACSGHGFKHSAGLGEAIAVDILGLDIKVSLEAFRFF